MNSGVQQVKATGPAGQNLPTPTEALPITDPTHSAARAPTSADLAWARASAAVLPQSPNAPKTTSQSQPGTAPRIPFENAILLALQRLNQPQAAEFEAAVQTDEHTEIVLRVSRNDGKTEVQAELRRGDPAPLLARWHELQERLAHHGLKLGDLHIGTGTAGAGRDGTGQPPDRFPPPVKASRRRSSQSDAPQDRTTERNSASPANASLPTRWESWA
jgi:hypothetical protein